MATRKYSYRRKRSSKKRRSRKGSKKRRSRKGSKKRRSRKGKKRRSSKKNNYQKGLTRWFNEKWVDVCTGRPCGRKKYSKKGMPYCRPSRRVNKGTPKTRKQLSSKRIREMCRRKRRNPTKRMKKA